jgi:hypothetical protein
MGLLSAVIDFVGRSSEKSLGLTIAGALGGFLVLSIVVNVLQQLLFKNPKEPPVVFHWVPIIGNTVTYGIDPYKFFFACREKVCRHRSPKACPRGADTFASMATSLRLCSLVVR